MIRLLIMLVVVAPVTLWYVAIILWHVYRNTPEAPRIADELPRRWAARLLGAAGVRVVLENEGAIDRNVPQVLVANHTSWFDVLALAAFTPGRYVFVAKKEVEYIPFLGRTIGACGHIFIDRKNHQAALASLAVARERLAREKPRVVMFPEGTRSESGELQPFKKGAFVLAIETGADIVPTGVLGSRAVMRKHSLLIHPGTITIRFGEPISVAGMTMEQRDQLMKDTRRALAGLLATPPETTN
ncbi:MAG: 1-acyl-sn-glycerol-3-phosphate acyltransferase [Gemmatimonadetes bacterium]|nr:1-acyl-sn-glycerol-3-phosphate acyltransferase [Gemmatimonadota bacterium]